MALNNTLLPTPDTVLTFRYGYLSYDDDYRVPEYDPAQLGFSPSFLSQITQNVFPEFYVDGYDYQGSWAGDDVRHYAHTLNGTLSRLLGSHTLKLGGDYRRIGVNQLVGGAAAGSFASTADSPPVRTRTTRIPRAVTPWRACFSAIPREASSTWVRGGTSS